MANGYNHALIIPTSLHKKEGETPLIIHPLVTLVTAGTTGGKKRTKNICNLFVSCFLPHENSCADGTSCLSQPHCQVHWPGEASLVPLTAAPDKWPRESSKWESGLAQSTRSISKSLYAFKGLAWFSQDNKRNCRRTLHPPVKQRKCFTTNSTKHTPRKSCDSICLHTQSANVSYCQWMVEVGVCGLTCGANLILLLSKDSVSSPSMQSQNHRPVTPEKQRTQRDASPANVEWCLNKRAIC